MRFRLFFLAALAVAQPISARPTLPEPEPARVPATPEEIDAAMESYGRWLQRVEQVQAPVQEALSSLSPEWQAAIGLGAREAAVRFTPVVERALSALDRSTAELGALELPAMAGTGLAGELRPDAIRAELIGVNGELRSAVGYFLPALEAMARGEEDAAMSATRRLIGSVAIVLDSQILLRRASLATTPREESPWEMLNTQLILDRVAARTVAAVRHAMDQQPDASYSADLSALADELETTVRRGTEKVDDEIASYTVEQSAAEQAGAQATARLMSRLVNVLTISRGYFPIGTRLAERVRAVSASFENGPLRLGTLAGFVNHLRSVRLEMGEISRRENEALAATP